MDVATYKYMWECDPSELKYKVFVKSYCGIEVRLGDLEFSDMSIELHKVVSVCAIPLTMRTLTGDIASRKQAKPRTQVTVVDILTCVRPLENVNLLPLKTKADMPALAILTRKSYSKESGY
uniref:Uncharacterized protein n=1 Tax=Glossina austeni TaxID=7395 RepID=A0A1A9V9R8_GLOAU